MFVAPYKASKSLIVAIFYCCVLVGSLEAQGTVSVEATTGLLQGKSVELVFFKNTDFLLSELTWDLDNVRVLGVALSYQWQDHCKLTFALQKKASKGNGAMVDLDWVDLDDPGPSRFSMHPVQVHRADQVRLEGELRLYSQPSFRIDAIGGYQQQSYAWDTVGGFLIYPGAAVALDHDEVGIGYRQDFTIPYGGLAAVLEVGSLSLKARVIGSPWVKARSVDHHFHRDLLFYGDCREGHFHAISWGLAYRLNQQWTIHLDHDVHHLNRMRGDARILDLETGDNRLIPGIEGLAHRHQLTRLGLRYLF